MKARLEIGEILRGYEGDLTKYSHHQRRVLWALRDCRTAALGGHIDACDACGNIKISYNSCRNRHCPKCQGLEKELWMLAREEELLPVTYFHVVFTLPHELNDLCRYNAEAMYDLLFSSAKQTLQQFGDDKQWLGAQLGITMVLHTWGQNLSLHPHIHCIVPNGGLRKDGTWQYPKKGNEKFLFPVAAMQSVYKALFMKGLHEKIVNKMINLPPDFPIEKSAYKSWKNALYEKKWVIYAKRPFGGPKQVIEYLGRYTHKVAISNHRLKGFDKDKGMVTFEYKDYKDGGKKKEIKIVSNRASGDLQLRFTADKAEKVTIKILDNAGQMVLKQTSEVKNNVNNIPLKNALDLAEGQYTVYLISSDETFSTSFLIWK